MRVLKTSVVVGILAPVAVRGVGRPVDSRFVVLGTDGKVVPDADPRQYMPKKLPGVYVQHAGEQQKLSPPSETKRSERFSRGQRVEAYFQPKEQEADILVLEDIGEIVNPFGEMLQAEMEDDEFAGPIKFQLEAVESPSPYFLDSEVPAVHGAIIFAELSCLFVAFIGYLVHSIRLWDGFSRGQKYCLTVVFLSAVLYQGAALAWYVGMLSPDIILGLSSLITRMISLGMVPITTTSFMGRARELCHEQQPSTTSSSSRSSRRQRQRARYS